LKGVENLVSTLGIHDHRLRKVHIDQRPHCIAFFASKELSWEIHYLVAEECTLVRSDTTFGTKVLFALKSALPILYSLKPVEQTQ
jgi:hypothetical protein